MKTFKYSALIFVCVCFFCLKSVAQTDYNKTQTIQRSGYAYQCDYKDGRVTLYNVNNFVTYGKWERKDGASVGDDYKLGQIRTLIYGPETKQKAKEIVRRIFSPSELNNIKKESLSLMVTLIINSTTGKVDEVNFEFYTSAGYDMIPIEKYRQIELELKEKLLFGVTEAGRKLKYCMTYFLFQP